MTDTIYETDILVWSEQQAGLLERLAAGERLNDPIDWAHVIEEVRDVGLSQLNACKSLLRQALIHLVKLHTHPDDPASSHWRGEVVTFLADAADRFAPSMRQRIDLDLLYAQALEAVTDQTTDTPCPYALTDLVGGGKPDVAALLRRLTPG